ncbi:MAG: cupin domain-containing protein [Chloroflexota bacterium]|nr:cupin domain-containing protein [Chloroflexota bacterium]
MRHIWILPALVAIAGLGPLALGQPSTVAQDATPPPASVGVTTQILGSGQPDAAPGETLGVRRNTFEPGGFVPPHRHPGALVLHVESGELTYTVVEGTVHIQRAATAGTPGPTEDLGPGQETVLRAGDWLFEQSVVHSARNATSGQTVVLVASLTAADMPFTMFHEMGTPAP